MLNHRSDRSASRKTDCLQATVAVLLITAFLPTLGAQGGPPRQGLYFTSPQEVGSVVTGLLKREDWKTLARYYDLTGTNIAHAELESGRFFLREEPPADAHPGLPWKYRHPFTPGFKFDRVEDSDEPGVIRVVVKVEIDEGGGMVRRGFSEFMMRKTVKGYQLLPPDQELARTPISARLVTSGGEALVAGRPTPSLKVAIRNDTPSDPGRGVAVALRGVRWADGPEDARRWLRPLKGRTVGSLEHGVGHQFATPGSTELAFETGLILPGEEFLALAPLTPRRDGRHELVVSYAVVGAGADWMGETLIYSGAPRYLGALFAHATPDLIDRRKEMIGAHMDESDVWPAWSIIGLLRPTAKPGSPPPPVRKATFALQLPVITEPRPGETGGLSWSQAAEKAGVALESAKYHTFYCAPQQAWFFVLADGSGVALRRKISTSGEVRSVAAAGFKWEAEPLPKAARGRLRAPFSTDKELCPR